MRVSAAYNGDEGGPVSEARVDQKDPAVGPMSDSAHNKIIKDLEERRELGLERYRTPLHTRDGRDSLVDFYQEYLDGLAYLRNELDKKARLASIAASADRRVAAVRRVFIENRNPVLMDYSNLNQLLDDVHALYLGLRMTT